MDEQIQSPNTNVPSPSKSKPLLLTPLVIILLVGVGGGMYYWQHKKVNDLASQVSTLKLQAKSATKETSTSSTKQTASTTSTFTYSPNTGGLSLTLAKSYGVIVKVDGNAGGAPGAIFNVASVTNGNTFSDPLYQGLNVDIGNTFTTLDHAVSAEESILNSQRGAGSTLDRNYKVSDTKVAGLPAKLLAADGLDEYQGNVTVYLVGSGSFLYTITANGTQNPFPTLTAVLNGLSIKSVTL